MDYYGVMRFGNPAKAVSNVDLWPDTRWNGNDLREFLDQLEEFGETSGQISFEPRGIGVEIMIAFVAGAVASGFFNKIGSDLHEAARDRLKKMLLKRGKLRAEEKGLLHIQYTRTETDSIDVAYHLEYEDAADLEEFLRHLNYLDEMLRRAYSANRYPFQAGGVYSINVTLTHPQKKRWHIHIAERSSSSGLEVRKKKVFQLEVESGKEPEEWATREFHGPDGVGKL